VVERAVGIGPELELQVLEELKLLETGEIDVGIARTREGRSWFRLRIVDANARALSLEMYTKGRNPMGVFPNENATASPFPGTQKQ
jgi:hypothetical protein